MGTTFTCMYIVNVNGLMSPAHRPMLCIAFTQKSLNRKTRPYLCLPQPHVPHVLSRLHVFFDLRREVLLISPKVAAAWHISSVEKVWVPQLSRLGSLHGNEMERLCDSINTLRSRQQGQSVILKRKQLLKLAAHERFGLQAFSDDLRGLGRHRVGNLDLHGPQHQR